jgi:hypothetical protein
VPPNLLAAFLSSACTLVIMMVPLSSPHMSLPQLMGRL